MTWDELERRLREPFLETAVSWRAGSLSRDKKRAQALAYAEPRVYEDRLNDVLGPNWSCRFIIWGDQRLLCELTVTVADGLGGTRIVTRTSTGEFDSGDKVAQGTAAEAQAFKRACSKFGLGRYLYDLPLTWVGYDENSRRLTETPSLPERFLPRPEPMRLDARRASLLHRELGKLASVRSSEHHRLAEEALGRPVDSFTGLTEAEGVAVLGHAKQADAERNRRNHANPERGRAASA